MSLTTIGESSNPPRIPVLHVISGKARRKISRAARGTQSGGAERPTHDGEEQGRSGLAILLLLPPSVRRPPPSDRSLIK